MYIGSDFYRSHSTEREKNRPANGKYSYLIVDQFIMIGFYRD